MEIKNIYEKKRQLNDLLKQCLLDPYTEIKTNTLSKQYYISLSVEMHTLTGYIDRFKKDFTSEEEIQEFINNLKNALSISLLEINQVKIFPSFSGGIPVFYYYINDKEVNSNDLKYVLQTDISSYKKIMQKQIDEIETKLHKLSFLALKYNDLKRNIESTKQNIKAAKANNKFNLKNNKIRIDTGLNVYRGEIYEIDLKKITEFGKNKESDKLMNLLEQIQTTILTGKYKIDIKNIYENFSVEELLIINKFLQIVDKRIINIEKTLNNNVDILKNEFEEIKTIINLINSKSVLDAHNLLQRTEIPDKIEKQQENNSEKEKFDISLIRNLTDKYTNYEPDNTKNLFIYLQKLQAEILTHDEKIALNLYKTQLYRAFNPIISYQRNNNITYNEVIENYICQAFDEMRKSYEAEKNNPYNALKKENEELIAIKFFKQFPDSMPSYEQYKNLVLTYLPYLLSALAKVITPEDIVVYRGTNNPYQDDFSIPLSTSIEKPIAREFIDKRAKTKKEVGALYKITIPKGSPVIIYSYELLTGEVYDKNPFPDDQKEILIDGGLYNFETKDNKLELNKTKPANYFELAAHPKELETKKTM